MKMTAYVGGVGMTPFGKHLDKGLKQLGALAINEALADAGIDAGQIQAAFMGNAAAPIITGQLCIAGQAVLRGMGIGRIPVVNVENACATSSTAFHLACAAVSAGQYDIVLACGFDKLYHQDKALSFKVFTGAIDVEGVADVYNYLAERARRHGETFDIANAGADRSVFMDIYADWIRDYMVATGATARHFAQVAEKNSYHGSLNPKAQFRDMMTADQVLAARPIVAPLTLAMCAPLGDGAAAAVVLSETARRRLGLDKAPRVAACLLGSGWDFAPGEAPMAAQLSKEVYEQAGIGPEDLSCVELHDATTPAELMYYEFLGLCAKNEGPRLLESGATRLGGRIPVNTSGGLTRKGHPIGATGISQIAELVDQLKGRAGARQVAGARVGMAENGGGFIGSDAAAMTLTVLTV
ncbi:MAG TPA: thiolase family protein [Rhodospirillaceae bacterium]|nr:thiolase family protein [Rhodospirillaceae bacterium]